MIKHWDTSGAQRSIAQFKTTIRQVAAEEGHTVLWAGFDGDGLEATIIKKNGKMLILDGTDGMERYAKHREGCLNHPNGAGCTAIIAKSKGLLPEAHGWQDKD